MWIVEYADINYYFEAKVGYEPYTLLSYSIKIQCIKIILWLI